MTPVSIISLSIAMLVLAASPGPGVFATVAKALASGFRQALAVILGIVVGDIMYLLFSVFGLSAIAQTMGTLFMIVKLCGGAYLFWIGIKIWFSKQQTVGSEQLQEKHSRSGNIMSGLLITLSNPKVILFYCGFLPTFIDLSKVAVVDIAIIVCVITFVLSSVLIVYAYVASHARQLFSSRKATQRLNRAAGGVMMATGIVVATK